MDASWRLYNHFKGTTKGVRPPNPHEENLADSMILSVFGNGGRVACLVINGSYLTMYGGDSWIIGLDVI